MPDATWFRVSTRSKLAKGEHGPTSLDSRALAASQALEWILSELPSEAVEVSTDTAGKSVIIIDWEKVPGYLREPPIPARSR